MILNTYTNGDPRSFFYYKGDYYINGTEIMLKDTYINNHKCNGRKLWKYAKYHHQTYYDGSVAYFFCISRCDWISLYRMGLDEHITDDCAGFFVIKALELEYAIQEITKPIKLERAQTEAILEAIAKPKSDLDNTGVILLWAAYIFVLIGSLIFRQFYLIWIVASILFIKYRKELLNR